MESSPRDLLIGQIIGGRYEIIREIGRGGTGSIYEVRNVRLGRSFALKTLAPLLASNREALQRFRREADIVARIKHPNIVDIVDWDELADGSPCIVMEYLDGQDLAARIRSVGPLGWPVIAHVADQVLAALSITHTSGVVHRDLKPHNIFLAKDGAGNEQVKLLDFGVSKVGDSQSLLTLDATLVGTPAYMAPEQAEGNTDAVGTFTDVWAMGVILYEMATGRRPFDGPSVPAILYKVCHVDPEPIEQLRRDAPAAFTDLVRHALTRSIPERLADVSVLRARLREALSGLSDIRYADPMRAPISAAEAGIAPVSSLDALAATAPLGTTLPTGTAVQADTPTRPLPTRAVAAGTPSPTTIAEASGDARPAGPPTRRTWLRYLPLVIAAVAVAAVVVVASRDSKSTEAGRIGTDARTEVAAGHPDAAALVVEQALDAAPVPDAATAPADAPQRVRKPPRDPIAKKPRVPASSAGYVDRVGAAIGARMHELVSCLNEHRGTTEAGAVITATLSIGADGKATSVTFTPGSVDKSALGNCLRAELLRAKYPTSDRDQRLSIPLRAKPAR